MENSGRTAPGQALSKGEDALLDIASDQGAPAKCPTRAAAKTRSGRFCRPTKDLRPAEDGQTEDMDAVDAELGDQNGA
jgi:hypothetical protein